MNRLNHTRRKTTTIQAGNPDLKSRHCYTTIPFTTLFIFAILACILSGASVTVAQFDKPVNTPDERKVLVLHSYDSTMAWTKNIQRGIESVFETSGVSVDMHVEYMDTIRHRTKETFGYLEDLYRKKYSDISFDVILLSDNNALNFILPRRDMLFPGVPIVFCGMNDFRPDQLHGQSDITGVNESIDIQGTIKLASRIMPDIKSFLVISDRTAAGLANRRKFENTLSRLPDTPFSFGLQDDLTTAELQDTLGKLSDDSAILLFMFRRDSSGRIFTPPEYFSMVVEGSNVPVFTFWLETSQDTDVMGGVMVSGEAQGKQAAEYALRILKGEPASSLPFMMKSPNVSILNYPQLKRFKVSKRVIPEGVIIRNEPVTFYYQHKAIIWLASFFIIAMAFLNTLLMINIARRKRTEKALSNSEQKYRNIFENATEGIFQSTLEGRFLSVNPAFARIEGYDSPGEMINMITDIKKHLYLHEEDRARLLDLLEKKDIVTNFEVEVQRKDNIIIWISINIRNVRDQDGNVLFLEGTIEDITERKKAEVKLKETYDIIEKSPVVAFLWRNSEGWPVEFVTENVEALFGYSAKEFTSGAVSYRETIHPDDIKRTAKEVAEYSKDQKRHIFDHEPYRIIARDGTIKWVNDSTLIRRNEKGEITYYQGILFDISDRMLAQEKLQDTLQSLRLAVNATIQVMVSAVEARDPYTAGHQIRSAELARAIATEMGLPEETIEGIYLAASIHDIGKLSIPAEILSKPTQLSDIEFLLVKEHPLHGYEILKNVQTDWPLAEIVYQHHERIDGSGYPRNLKGEEILIEARILAVADVVEAIASHRPYRPALGVDAALEEISKNRGIFYDSKVVDSCLTLFEKKDYRLDEH